MPQATAVSRRRATDGLTRAHVSAAAFLLVPLALFAAVAWWTWREARAEAETTAERVTAALAEHAQRVLEVQEALLSAALGYVRGRSPDDVAADRRVHEFLVSLRERSESSRSLILIRLDRGRIIAWNGQFPVPDVDVSRRDYVEAHKDGNGDLFIGQVVQARPSGGIGFTISRRDPETGIAAVSQLPLGEFHAFYANLTRAAGDVMNLVRADGAILVRYPAPAEPVGLRMPPNALFWQSKESVQAPPTVYRSAFDGIERLIHQRQIASYPIFASYGMDFRAVRAAWLRQLVPFGLLALGASAALLWLTRRWQRAVRETAVAQADVRSRDALAVVNSQLRDSEARYRTLFAGNPNPMWVYDKETLRFLAVNDAAVARYGYSRAEFLAMTIADIRPPEEVPRLRRALDEMGDNVSAPGVFRHRKRDGTVIDVEISAHILDFDGRKAVAVLAHDVTERQRATERIHLLMREVNHRSKNLLSLVQAVARQTAASEPAEFVQRFSERVQALAKSQDLLVKNEWQGVALHELAHSLLAHFGDLIGTRLHLRGPELRLSAAAAQTIGMALHELATNAGKYGALSNATGEVDLAWRLSSGADGQRRFALEWIERGGPPVARPTRRGFGSTVVDAMSRMNLAANVTLDFAPAGLRWRLECAVETVLEDGASARGDAAVAPPPELPPPHAAAHRVLVVEDEALLALDLAQRLRQAGFAVVGPVSSVAQAQAFLAGGGCDVALLDVNLGGETSEPVARELRQRGIPFVGLTGYSRAQQPAAFADAPLLPKPVHMAQLIAELRRAIDSAPAGA